MNKLEQEMLEQYAWIDELAEADETEKALLWEQAKQRARDATTTNPNAITAGFSTVKKILPQVSNDTPHKPLKTLAEKVTEELHECEGCTGDCLKKHNRWRQPELEDNEVVYYRCEYGIQRKRQYELESQFRSSRIPARYLNKTLRDYSVDGFNRAAAEFAKQALTAPIGAYFFGECGTGKTFLAALIAQDFMRAGKSVIFTKVPSLLDDIRTTFNGNGRELDMLDELRAANLVVLDDFGMEKPTQWAGSTLCKILDMRYDNPNTRTIITSNMSPEDLAKHLNHATDGMNLNGSRILDRCREICKPILLKGTTRRN